MIRKRIEVSGRVQGVGYRYFTQKNARKLGLTGWVKNLGNGNVLLEAQGSEDKLAVLIQKLKSGPSFSSVQDIIIDATDLQENEEHFNIAY